jgi:cobalt-zinc-cadmium efflux system outer membrane protein
MISVLKRVVAYAAALLFSFSFLIVDLAVIAKAQSKTSDLAALARSSNSSAEPERNKVSRTIELYFDPLQGASTIDLVQRALTSNLELAAARLEISKARARLRQASLRPNPSLDVEQMTGGLTGSAGERETSIGVSLPLEVAGQRRRRIDVAQAQLEATEEEVAERERRLAAEVFVAYAEALAALRELEITDGLNELDLQTARFVQARVNEGESAPIELSLLQVEVDRLRSRRALVEGRLQAILLRLKNLAGIPFNELLRLREDLSTSQEQWQRPASVDAAIEIAMRTRPDLRLAQLNLEVARAGLSLAQSQSAPEVVASAKYIQNRSIFNETPVGPISDRDKLLTFGVSVGIPVFSRNQGAKAEAALAISQAERRQEFLQTVVRSEVASAYARVEAVQKSLTMFDQGVISRSNDNIRAIRAAYQLGEFKITDLLTEQRRLLDSQKEFTEALAERYRALADLRTAIGAPLTGNERQKQ